MIYILKCEASVRLCALWSQRALTLYIHSDRLMRCRDRYIRCQRSLAVKPLNGPYSQQVSAWPTTASGVVSCDRIARSAIVACSNNKWFCYWLCKYHALMFEQLCSFKKIGFRGQCFHYISFSMRYAFLSSQLAARGQFGDGSTPKCAHYILIYLCAKIGAFIKKCTIGLNITGSEWVSE